MSIIRSNIARQLLAEGGAPRSPGNTTLQRVLPRMDGLRPGFYGPDMGEGGKESDFGLDTYSTSDVDFGGESGGTRQEFRETAEILGTPKTPRFSDTFRANQLKKQKDIIFGNSKPSLSFIANILAGPQREVYNTDIIGPDLDQYGISGKNLTRARDIQKEIDNYEKTGRLSQSDFEKAFFGPGGRPPRGEGGDNEPIIKLKAPITEKIEEKPKREFDDILKFYGARFEDGGDVRQNYGLGSIVKKATRAIKKVAKSPLGKAALAFGAYKLAGSPELFAKDSFIMKNKALSGILAASLASGLYAKEEEEDETLPTVSNTDPQMTRTLEFYGGPRRFAEDGGDIEDAPMKTASMPSSFGELNQLSIDLFGRPYDQLNDSEQEILIEYFTKGKKQGIERATAAMGGMMEKDEMLDLGGNEMDLRGGGFVPLGEYEKKDDVPARLSKNEFVFTADAVRAAGGGSVDRGADIMYKTMKNLENKVA